MSVPETIAAALIAWIAAVLAVRWLIVPLLRRGPGGDAVFCLLWLGSRLYVRLLHRARYAGCEETRRQARPGPLIVVSNHTSAVDPLLVQTGCCFQIRWLMAADMMSRELDWLWRQQRIIPVQRGGDVAVGSAGPQGAGRRQAGPARGGGSMPVREAIRHVRGGGVIGIFPEGRIVKPRGEVRPFFSGVGAIIARTGAPVLLVWLHGTPDTERMSESFITRSRSVVDFIDVMRFEGQRDAEAITQALRERLIEASGWRPNDAPMPPSEEELAEGEESEASESRSERIAATGRV